MIGVGLTIIVGVMRCVNYAQGEFLAVGMYLTLCLVQWTGLSSYALIGPVVALVFFLGMAAYSVTVRPIIDQPGTRKIVATMGLGYVISNVLQIIFSADYRSTGFYYGGGIAQYRSFYSGLRQGMDLGLHDYLRFVGISVAQ